MQVEQLLGPRATSAEVDYPQEPNYGPAFPDETTAEKRQKEHRNIKRKEIGHMPDSRGPRPNDRHF